MKDINTYQVAYFIILMKYDLLEVFEQTVRETKKVNVRRYMSTTDIDDWGSDIGEIDTEVSMAQINGEWASLLDMLIH